MLENHIWRERKRNALGLPWSFTVYTLTDEKLLVESGIFAKTLEEVFLYRIKDITLKRAFHQRIFGIGTMHFCTNDKSTPEFDLKNVKNPKEVKELISKTIEECRIRKGVTIRELMGGSDAESSEEHEEFMG